MDLHKNSVFSCFTRFVAFVEKKFGMTLKIFQSDGGRISLCDEPSFFLSKDERKHRHISEMGRTLMIASSVPLYFWAELKLFALICF